MHQPSRRGRPYSGSCLCMGHPLRGVEDFSSSQTRSPDLPTNAADSYPGYYCVTCASGTCQACLDEAHLG
eukprot:3509791-Amphidinium_carterae.1